VFLKDNRGETPASALKSTDVHVPNEPVPPEKLEAK
jgi:hypothetical protein